MPEPVDRYITFRVPAKLKVAAQQAAQHAGFPSLASWLRHVLRQAVRPQKRRKTR